MNKIIILAVVALCSCRDKTPEMLDIKVGDKYLFSYIWNSKDPFRKITIDTITILGVKQGYAKFKTQTGYTSSEPVDRLQEYIKPCN